MNKLLVAVVMCALMMGCGSPQPVAKPGAKSAETAFPYKIEKVHRVFAQGVGPYSVMYEVEGKVLEHKFVTSSSRPAKVVMDVEPNGMMWVEMEEKLAIIHVRSSDDISPGTGTVKNGKVTENRQGNVVK